jgi:hypothetical protein
MKRKPVIIFLTFNKCNQYLKKRGSSVNSMAKIILKKKWLFIPLNAM